MKIKKNPLNSLKKQLFFLLVFVVFSFILCNKVDEITSKPNAQAKFIFSAVTGSINKYKFINQSTQASTIYWSMGDGNKYYAKDTVEYQFTNKGTYKVKLFALGGSGNIDSSSQDVVINETYNPWSEFLAGGLGTSKKIWVMAPIEKALVVGPLPPQTCCPSMGEPPLYQNNWWASALTDVAIRSCFFNTTYEFSYDGVLKRDVKGSFWSDPVYAPNPASCLDVAIFWTGNLAPFGNGTFSYTINLTTQELVVSGMGAYIGLYKVQETGDPDKNTNPQPIDKITYKIHTLTASKLIIYKDVDNGTVSKGARWYFTLQPQ